MYLAQAQPGNQADMIFFQPESYLTVRNYPTVCNPTVRSYFFLLSQYQVNDVFGQLILRKVSSSQDTSFFDGNRLKSSLELSLLVTSLELEY